MNRKFIIPIVLAILAVAAMILLFPFPTGEQGDPQATPTESMTVPQTPPVETPPPETAPPPTPAADALEAPYAFAYSTQERGFYYVKGSESDRIAPASLTKMLTALLALEVLPEDEVITVGEEVGWIAYNSSIAYIQKGQKLRTDMLVEGLLLQSGNDAAYTLAVAAGRKLANNPELSAKGALRRFMEYVNLRAQALGLEGTHFENPDGIDGEDHYTCITDLVQMAALAMENATIRKYVAMPKDTVTYESGESITWQNTNSLLHKDSAFYCPDAVGLKTGTTDKAGNCLISAFEQPGGGYLIIGVLGGKSYDGRYKDTLLLYDLYK